MRKTSHHYRDKHSQSRDRYDERHKGIGMIMRDINGIGMMMRDINGIGMTTIVEVKLEVERDLGRAPRTKCGRLGTMLKMIQLIVIQMLMINQLVLALVLLMLLCCQNLFRHQILDQTPFFLERNKRRKTMQKVVIGARITLIMVTEVQQ